MENSGVENFSSKHHLLEMVQVAFIITDVHSNILYANGDAEHLFGYSKGEIEGQRMRVLFLEEDLTYFLPNIIYLTVYKNGFEGEALLRQKDGTKIFVHLSTNSFNEGGETFLTFSFQEIQRLKKLEKEMVEMERWASLGMIVEEIAHQIRNPIVSIGGYTRRLQKSVPSDHKGGHYLNQILRETGRLETLIQRVEEYVLLPKPTFQKENIQEVVEIAIQTSSTKAMEKGVTFNLETGALKLDGNLFIDRNLVVKAISNIFENSVEALTGATAGKERKTVNVVLFDDDERAGVSISDKGEGISQKNLRHIFDPFFSTRADRVGLGLTITKRVIDENMGKIQVESQLKRGTTITTSFPKDRRRPVRRKSVIPLQSS